MKASILSYYPVLDGAEAEVNRFTFCLKDGVTNPHAETIFLRMPRFGLSNSITAMHSLECFKNKAERLEARTHEKEADTNIGPG